jgi:hypothetical protein
MKQINQINQITFKFLLITILSLMLITANSNLLKKSSLLKKNKSQNNNQYSYYWPRPTNFLLSDICKFDIKDGSNICPYSYSNYFKDRCYEECKKPQIFKDGDCYNGQTKTHTPKSIAHDCGRIPNWYQYNMRFNKILHQGKCYQNCHDLSIGMGSKCIIDNTLYCIPMGKVCTKEKVQTGDLKIF